MEDQVVEIESTELVEEAMPVVQVEPVEEVEIEEVEVTFPLPLQFRVLKSFETISETPFWPSEITDVVDALMTPRTFKELNEVMNNSMSNSVNNMDRSLKEYRKNYRAYLTDLDKTPNVFSFDVDYI